MQYARVRHNGRRFARSILSLMTPASIREKAPGFISVSLAGTRTGRAVDRARCAGMLEEAREWHRAAVLPPSRSSRPVPSWSAVRGEIVYGRKRKRVRVRVRKRRVARRRV